MTGDWKPGQVALVDSWRGDGLLAFRCERIRDEPTWCVFSDGDTRGLHDEEVRRARPVAVVDPEDRQAVERLLSLVGDALNWGPHKMERLSYVEPFQAALREFAAPTPPRPNEPPPWSVAIVANSTPFTRVGADHITKPYSRCWFGEHPTTGEDSRFTWDELHEFGEVRVVGRGLSEGIEQP